MTTERNKRVGRFERRGNAPVTAPIQRRRPAPAPTRWTGILSLFSMILTLVILAYLVPYGGSRSQSTTVRVSIPDITGKFNSLMAGSTFHPTAEAVQEMEAMIPQKTYKLSDSDLVAPVPNPEGYGRVNTAEELSWLPMKANKLLDGQQLYFSSDLDILDWGGINYYLDDSIAVVTWKEACGNNVLTFAEVKISDGSQFRRFLAGGQFGAETQYHTTEMAQSVNAVLASSGDFYKFRYNGVVVYDGQVRRVNTNKADTCYIDMDGNMLFSSQNTVWTQEEAQQFVDDNNIRFSLTFGPILIQDGVRCEPADYDLGEINQFSPRAALCQLGECHYLVITSNAEREYSGHLTMHQFVDRIEKIGCDRAYALDGGQTAAIALDGELVNNVLYGQQRAISDIIYFATAETAGG